MVAIAERLLHKSFSSPDEVRTSPKARVEIVNLGDITVMRAIFQPGWRWSIHLKPQAGTESCEVAHLGYLVSGRLATRMNDGTEIEGKPGDVVSIPPGHDGWVVGNEPAVFIAFTGGEIYAK
jgi:quercetin dioxygenase-like cupin family protein